MVSTGSGGRTKYNRHRFSIPKTHALDAVCAGSMDHITGIHGWQQPTLLIAATGRGAYKRTRLTSDGFPRGYLMHSKSVHGFTTGDMVRALVPTGTKRGSYLARVAVRASGFHSTCKPVMLSFRASPTNTAACYNEPTATVTTFKLSRKEMRGKKQKRWHTPRHSPRLERRGLPQQLDEH